MTSQALIIVELLLLHTHEKQTPKKIKFKNIGRSSRTNTKKKRDKNQKRKRKQRMKRKKNKQKKVENKRVKGQNSEWERGSEKDKGGKW